MTILLDGTNGVTTAGITLGSTAIASTGAEINILDGVTSTAAELNILDGVTSTAAELNILDGVTSTAAELNILDGVTSTAAELNILDGVTSTAAELNILDGVTATAAELNLIDGGTARGTTALADGDGILINDAGTMRMSTVQTVKTYMADGAGLSTLIAKEANFGTGASVTLSLGDHVQQTFWIENIRGNNASRRLITRMTDGSDTLISGNEYVAILDNYASTQEEYDQQANFRLITYIPTDAQSSKLLGAKIVVNNAKSTVIGTTFESTWQFADPNTLTVQPYNAIKGRMRTVEANNALVFGFEDDGNNQAFSSGIKYTHIGLS